MSKSRSKLGILSLGIAIATPVLVVLLLLITLGLNSIDRDIGKPFGIVWVVFGASAPVLHLLGVIFGLIGLLSGNHGKGIPITGAVLNLFLMIAGAGIIFLFLSNLTWGFR
ncbi:MAG: hypothetical protein HKN33_16585 [Pyrinomonadaceae bacterium]|nr:hypothetical protein [Pyrinomonadaceae bacterium]